MSALTFAKLFELSAFVSCLSRFVLLTAPRGIYHCVEDMILLLLLSYIHELTDNLLIHVVQLNATVWRNSGHGLVTIRLISIAIRNALTVLFWSNKNEHNAVFLLPRHFRRPFVFDKHDWNSVWREQEARTILKANHATRLAFCTVSFREDERLFSQWLHFKCNASFFDLLMNYYFLLWWNCFLNVLSLYPIMINHRELKFFSRDKTTFMELKNKTRTPVFLR